MIRVSSVRRRAQRGSALLIVFVFAAIVAITLYAEMPIVAFEAKRDKEQLLIDRGNEYAHAVKLFVRKFGTYPASIDQLENTNRMRFLRNRYKDPFTGKEDWRILHAGPGGMLIDSKVKAANPLATPPASTSSFGSNSSFGSTSTTVSGVEAMARINANSDFGQPGFGSSSQSGGANSPEAVVVPPLAQRRPAVSAVGAGSTTEGVSGDATTPATEGEQSPTAPLLTPAQTDLLAGAPTDQTSAPTGKTEPEQAVSAGGEVEAPSAAQGQPGNAPVPVRAGNLPPPERGAQVGQDAAAGEPDAAAQSATNTVQNMLNPRPQQSLLAGSRASTGSTLGQISSGGIAGVASQAHGHSIKTVNDQTDYSLWEFYYDPTKDLTRGMPGLGQGGAQQRLSATNGTNTGAQPQSSFGQNSINQGAAATNPTTTTPSSPAFPANPGDPPR